MEQLVSMLSPRLKIATKGEYITDIPEGHQPCMLHDYRTSPPVFKSNANLAVLKLSSGRRRIPERAVLN